LDVPLGLIVAGVAALLIGGVIDWWRDQMNPPVPGQKRPTKVLPLIVAATGLVIAWTSLVNRPDRPTPKLDVSNLSCSPERVESASFGPGSVRVQECSGPTN
jgi:hypothetical protein